MAAYTFFLKNGGKITVEDYWEDGEMIRMSVAGGMMVMRRDQIESIVEVAKPPAPPAKKNPPPPAQKSSAPPQTEQAPQKAPKPAETQGKSEATPPPAANSPEGSPVSTQPEPTAPSPEELKAEQRAREEKQYQDRVRDVTERIKTLMARYAVATRGQAGTDPTVLRTQKAIDARTADLNSRIKDAERRRGSQDRVGPPMAPYSPMEKELSDLRSQIDELENQRTHLIEEMRQKDFDVGSLFLP